MDRGRYDVTDDAGRAGVVVGEEGEVRVRRVHSKGWLIFWTVAGVPCILACFAVNPLLGVVATAIECGFAWWMSAPVRPPKI
jgi:hypothetical protein